MKRLGVVLALGLLLAVACDGVYRIVVPYCPVSDSAKAHADSVPMPCLFADSTRKAP